MSPVKSRFILSLLFAVSCRVLQGQEAISAIDQARLLQKPPEAAIPAVDANGNAIDATSDVGDDSFGAQMILKDQVRPPAFALSAGGSIYYTSNVALTRRDTRDDSFAVVNATGSWIRQLNPEVQFQAGLQASIFRYGRTSQLDFDDFNAGLGLAWAPLRWPGVSIFGRYDFTELIDRHGNEILSDHQFSLGTQKVFVLGRAHAFSVGVLGTAGISTPHVAQRDQAGIFASYHLQLTRCLGTDLLYRFAGQFYNEGGRTDLNQVFSWNLGYQLGRWTQASIYFSFGDNHSNKSVFDYDVTSTGGGLGFTTRF
ncbi:MAG: hypothetical protein ACREIF_16960 [Chthoniobacterales bacterium]